MRRLSSLYHQYLILFVIVSYLSAFCNGAAINNTDSPSCDKTLRESLGYLSTKTPYVYQGVEDLQYVPEGCTAERMFYFGRHGTRNPGKNEISYMQNDLPILLHDIQKNYEEGRGTLCKVDFSHLNSWFPYPGLNITEQKFLVEQGREELFGIATRYQTRFPDLLPTIFTNSSYFLKYTKSQRTEETAKSFARGLFGKDGYKKAWFAKAEKPDPVLKFYDDCEKWENEVDNNPEAYEEKTIFETSKQTNKTIAKVSRRLGFQRNLTLEEVNMIYLTCSFETAWEGGRILSPWCAAFDLLDFQAMNFREDLDYYWKDGYGHELNYKIACPPIKNLVEIFDDKNSTRKFTGYFTHSGANLKILARLGVFKDEKPLTVSEYNNQRIFREWNTTFMDTMASNIAFVLYNCPTHEDATEKIGFFFQEKPTSLPACEDKWICPYEKFKESLSEIISTCDLDKFCSAEENNCGLGSQETNCENTTPNHSSKLWPQSSFVLLLLCMCMKSVLLNFMGFNCS